MIFNCCDLALRSKGSSYGLHAFLLCGRGVEPEEDDSLIPQLPCRDPELGVSESRFEGLLAAGHISTTWSRSKS